ncbi:GDP-fucose transporter 1 [Schistosoma japonicum]|nr:GDP-fucose transporter 1 [Schistosoma japonicum]KAH8870962.1 GDP-fucose transporter 1 [Schistosoma japonicum]KAH8870963.1 GDP-fucose transporter 1 [Schistosoma japonicum]
MRVSKRGKNMISKIITVVSAYWIISISLVFINKWLLSGESVSLNAPFFITWFQCAITAFLCYSTSYLTLLLPSHVKFPQLNFSFKTSIEVLPLSVIFVLMVCFNNLCLKYLSVSFYFLARSLTIIFNVIFTYFLLNVKTSPKALACCAVIIVGYCVGIIVEGNLGPLSLIGVIFGTASSITCALNSIYTAKCLPKVEGSVWRLTFYNNINSLLLLIPVIGLLEYQSITEHLFYTSIYFWFIMLISGIFGFAIGYISTLQIQVTSPLTHNVSGTAKAAAQTVLAVIIYHEIKSVSWWLSNVITLGGSIFYSAVRHSENVRKPKESVDFNQNDKSSILVVDDGDDTKHSLLNHLNNNSNKNSLFDTSDVLPSSRIGLV